MSEEVAQPGRRTVRRPIPVETTERSAATSTSSLPLIVLAFLVSVVIPFIITAGPLRLSVNRLVLLVLLVPLIALWLQGRGGRLRLPDVLVLFICVWTSASFFVVHGPSIAIEASGIFVIETLGAFLVGRCCVRNSEYFYKMVLIFFVILMVLLPFAIFETLTGHNILLDLFGMFWTVLGDAWKAPRWGFDRVQSVFLHPILYGVFAGMGLALTYYVLGYQRPFLMRAFSTGLVFIAAMVSFSSGPLISLVVQALLIGWDQTLKFLKARWLILCAGAVSMLVLLELVARRSAAEIVISYLAFNTKTAFNRLWIWHFGTDSVKRHPWFGLGFNEWERAPWMSTSIDMFWLAPAVRHGLPAGLAAHALFLAIFLGIALARISDTRLRSYRTGYLICLAGVYIAGWTVNYWKESYTVYMFLLGAGMWMMSSQQSAVLPPPTVAGSDKRKPKTAKARRDQVAGGGAADLPKRRRSA